jgi:hypothetical protein
MNTNFAKAQLDGAAKELEQMENLQTYDKERLLHLEGRVFLILVLYSNYLSNTAIRESARKLFNKLTALNKTLKGAQPKGAQDITNKDSLVQLTIDKKALMSSLVTTEIENKDLSEKLDKIKKQLKAKSLELGRVKKQLEKAKNENG